MACTTIHMAIAKKYCENHPEENYKDFLLGSNLPDITDNKNLTHFGNVSTCLTYFDYARNKINLKKMIENTNLNNSLNRGTFMHLITDYVFFNDFNIIKDKNILKTKTAKELRDICTNDYDNITNKVVKKYKIDLNEMPEFLAKFLGKDEGKELVFHKENKLFELIENISKANLYEIYDAIKNNNLSVLDKLFTKEE